MIHAMCCGVVLTSGAGTSLSGPITSTSSAAYRRVIRSISEAESVLGSQVTPPFPPPNGRSTTAHFQVIQKASAVTSSSVTPGWKRIPPFAGPRAKLYCTRYPVKTSIPPSSRWNGIEKMICREGWVRIALIPASRLSRDAASLKYAIASPKTLTSRTAVVLGTAVDIE
jgi:hypothetical protein